MDCFDELVSLVKVFRLFRLEWIVLMNWFLWWKCLDSLDWNGLFWCPVDTSTASYLLVGPVCWWCLPCSPCTMEVPTQSPFFSWGVCNCKQILEPDSKLDWGQSFWNLVKIMPKPLKNYNFPKKEKDPIPKPKFK